MILDASKIEYVNFNERDVEAPALVSALDRFKPVSVLDVGACYSWYTYAHAVRGLVPRGGYEALDLLPDEQTAAIVDHYHVAGVREFALDATRRFDVTFSVSVLEHVGVKPERVSNDRELRQGFVRAMLGLTERAAFLTFPFGAGGWCPGECIVVPDEELWAFQALGLDKGFESKCQFFYSPFPQGREKWSQVSREVASAVPLRLELGCTCVALLLLTR
jgi:hypothetical protein